MENILITGANGQLGSELRSINEGRSQYNIYYTDVEELDITSADAVQAFVSEKQIAKIINCAAYNEVDRAESEPDAAIRLNVMAAMNLAEAAARNGAWLIHFSTDFVFDGRAATDYLEADKPNPISQYGRTKHAGEIAVRRSGCKSIIIRTSWLYSPLGKKNFVKSMLALAEEEFSLKVVYDQVGSPTYARDLAQAVMHILPQLTDEMPRYGEVFHYSNTGHCSRAAYAEKIMQLAKEECEIVPISSEEYITPATRPARAVLDSSLICRTFGLRISTWERSLSKAIRLFK